jgi:hypothetical protein
MNISMSYSPYAEPNVMLTIGAAVTNATGLPITDASVDFELNATNYTMAYNATSGNYESTVTFLIADVGNWTFNVFANKTGYTDQWQNGTIRIRQPIYITLRLYQDNNQTVYSDNLAQAVLGSSYDCAPYVTATTVDPYSGETTYHSECYYHANYTGGVAQLTVYEKGSYNFYLISGVMTYDNTFAYPDIERQTYSLPLGSFSVISSPRNIDIVMTSCELDPEQCGRFYISIFLWILMVLMAGIVGVIVGKLVGVSAGFGVGIFVLIGLILLRFALLGY